MQLHFPLRRSCFSGSSAYPTAKSSHLRTWPSLLEMTITTQLYKRNCILWIFCGWDAVGNPGTKPGFNVSKVSSESNTPCVEGKYRGKSRITYLWPDGVPGGGWNQSIVRDLTC